MTSSEDACPQVWEAWHARFGYQEGHGYKFRPVIVVGVHEDGSLVMMVTSSTNRLRLEHYYPLRDWREAGPDKPSVPRADRVAEMPHGYLGTAGRIGRLSERDIAAISGMLSQIDRWA